MIQISKPLTGGTGSVTTGEWESGNDLDTASQASAIEDLLDALVTLDFVMQNLKQILKKPVCEVTNSFHL